jgi:hypothetical protein
LSSWCPRNGRTKRGLLMILTFLSTGVILLPRN